MRLLMVASLLLAGPLSAQNIPRGFHAWWDSPLAANLNLSPDQIRQVKSTVHEFRPKLIDLRAQVQKAEIEVEDAFNDDNFDARQTGVAVERLIGARGDLGRAMAQLSLRLRAILTAAQWHELQQRSPARERLNRPGRPGRRQM